MTSISDVRGEQEGIFPTTVPRGCHVMTTRASRPAERRCPGLPPPDDSVLDDDTNTVPFIVGGSLLSSVRRRQTFQRSVSATAYSRPLQGRWIADQPLKRILCSFFLGSDLVKPHIGGWETHTCHYPENGHVASTSLLFRHPFDFRWARSVCFGII